MMSAEEYLIYLNYFIVTLCEIHVSISSAKSFIESSGVHVLGSIVNGLELALLEEPG